MSESERTPEERRAAAQSLNRRLMTASVAFILGLAIFGATTGLSGREGVRLSLDALEAESIELPPEMVGLPLHEIYKQIDGANLDRPRAHIMLIDKGRIRAEAWGEGSGLKAAIADAYKKAKEKTRGEITEAMLVIPTDRRLVKGGATKRHFSNVHRGVRGAFIETNGETYRLSPTQTVASNRPIPKELEREAKTRNLSVEDWLKQSIVHSFSARQFYFDIAGKKPPVETLRGNKLIPVSAVTQESVKEFESLLTDWMFNNLRPDGRMTYIYEPSLSRGNRDNNNNMIRQWMGTVAMGRAAKIHPERNATAASTQNIRYNLQQFYRSEGDLGWIEFHKQAKLGAAALAMISLIESPHREMFEKEEKGLFNLTMHLWQENGRFKTFLKPESRDDENHNYYPGETLLGWAFLYDQDPDPKLLDRAMKSMRHYKTWHLNNRGPAFVPWHAQAYYIFWKHTRSKELQDWVFEMNDWLVDQMQTYSRVAYDDTLGRFYHPRKRYGTPHASSTGVYLEGLIDAFSMAREIGDKHHEEKYRKAIVLGLRSSMQLQFQDNIDMFYSPQRHRLRGGMRTTVYDNHIRVDNVQHVLMGVQKIIREFKPEDYKLTD